MEARLEFFFSIRVIRVIRGFLAFLQIVPCASRTDHEECMKFSARYRWLLHATLCCLPLLAGCELFQHFSRPPVERAEKEPIAGAPGKYSVRVSQFIFLADVEIRRDHAIFKDLSNLREQVYRELRLPDRKSTCLN